MSEKSSWLRAAVNRRPLKGDPNPETNAILPQHRDEARFDEPPLRLPLLVVEKVVWGKMAGLGPAGSKLHHVLPFESVVMGDQKELVQADAAHGDTDDEGGRPGEEERCGSGMAVEIQGALKGEYSDAGGGETQTDRCDSIPHGGEHPSPSLELDIVVMGQ